MKLRLKKYCTTPLSSTVGFTTRTTPSIGVWLVSCVQAIYPGSSRTMLFGVRRGIT